MCVPTVAKQGFGENVTAATNTHIIKELLDTLFSMPSLLYQRKEGDYFFTELLIKLLSYDLKQSESKV
jgi:hypothetical protein